MLNPLGLLFGGLLGVLVLLYLWERRRQREEVPSLLLWEGVPEDVLQRRRLQTDWLFVLQALLLTALVIGVARPYLTGEPLPGGARRQILIMDISASMGTREGRQTRYEIAAGAAETLIGHLSDDAEAMLIAVDVRPTIAQEFTRDHAALVNALHGLEPHDTPTNVSAAVALARRAQARDPEHTEITLFTDLPETALEPDDRALVQRVGVGETSNNLAISALHVFQGPFEDAKHARAYTLVQNYSYAEQHGFLTVSLDGQVVTRTGFTLPGRASRTFLAKNFVGPGMLTARLEVNDALAADNQAFAWVRAGQRIHALLVSPPSGLADDVAAIARAVPGLQVDTLSPDAYSPQAASGADVVIFHRCAFEAPAAALYIFPPADNPIFSVEGELSGVEVIDWNDRHETLRGLRPLPAWPLTAARLVSAPAGSETLLWSRTDTREFPLAFTATRNGNRIACLAFDLDAEGLRNNDNVPLLVFFLNLVHWLAQSGAHNPLEIATGEVAALDDFAPGGSVQITDPRGHTTTAPPGAIQLEANLAGVYHLHAGDSDRLVLANFADSAESDIGRGDHGGPAPRPAPAARPRPPQRARREYGQWLYGLAACLMLIEWSAWRRRG